MDRSMRCLLLALLALLAGVPWATGSARADEDLDAEAIEALRAALVRAYERQAPVHRAWTVSGADDEPVRHVELYREGDRCGLSVFLRGDSAQDEEREIRDVTDGDFMVTYEIGSEEPWFVSLGANGLNRLRPAWEHARALVKELYGLDLATPYTFRPVTTMEADETAGKFVIALRVVNHVPAARWLDHDAFAGRTVTASEDVVNVASKRSRASIGRADGLPIEIALLGEAGIVSRRLLPTKVRRTVDEWRGVIEDDCRTASRLPAGWLDGSLLDAQFAWLLADLLRRNPVLLERRHTLFAIPGLMLSVRYAGVPLDAWVRDAMESADPQAALGEALRTMWTPLGEALGEALEAAHPDGAFEPAEKALVEKAVWWTIASRMGMASGLMDSLEPPAAEDGAGK